MPTVRALHPPGCGWMSFPWRQTAPDRFIRKTSPSPVSFANPTQLQSLSSNGASVYENATQFITGNISTVALTFNYSVTGGGNAAAPVLTYISAGVKQTATLTQSNQVF